MLGSCENAFSPSLSTFFYRRGSGLRCSDSPSRLLTSATFSPLPGCVLLAHHGLTLGLRSGDVGQLRAIQASGEPSCSLTPPFLVSHSKWLILPSSRIYFPSAGPTIGLS